MTSRMATKSDKANKEQDHMSEQQQGLKGVRLEEPISVGEITGYLDQVLGTGKWQHTIQHTNFPPNFATVTANLTVFNKTEQAPDAIPSVYPGIGAARVEKGRLFAATSEAYRLSLLHALSNAGVDVEFPGEEEVEETKPAPKSYGGGQPKAGGYSSKGPGRDSDPEEGSGEFECAQCNSEITAYTKKDGSQMSPKRIADWAMRDFSRPLCWDCLKVELDKAKSKSGGGYSRGGGYNKGGYRGR